MAGNDCLPNMQILTSCFLQQPSWPRFFHFPAMVGEVVCCLLGYIPGHSGFLVARWAWGGRVAELPWGGCLVADSRQVAPSGFVVTEERHRPRVRVAAGSSSPVLRILTTVTCLSSCAQEVACCLLLCLRLPFLVTCLPVPADRWLLVSPDTLEVGWVGTGPSEGSPGDEGPLALPCVEC